MIGTSVDTYLWALPDDDPVKVNGIDPPTLRSMLKQDFDGTSPVIDPQDSGINNPYDSIPDICMTTSANDADENFATLNQLRNDVAYSKEFIEYIDGQLAQTCEKDHRERINNL